MAMNYPGNLDPGDHGCGTVAGEIVYLFEAAAQLSSLLRYRNKRIRKRPAILRLIVYTN